MDGTPKSLRLQIALFGRVNAGKSTLLNRIAGQDVAIVSPEAGTTTDVVEKAMELPPFGPVLFLDTAGIDDCGELGILRAERTRRIFDRADVAVVVTAPGVWGAPEKEICDAAKEHDIPIIVVVNKSDTATSGELFPAGTGKTNRIALSARTDDRDALLEKFKAALLEALPGDFLTDPPLLRRWLGAGELAVLIVPVDMQAPRGRLILPQVQSIRDALDADAQVAVVKETQYPAFLRRLIRPPELVVCDSQAVDFMVGNTPEAIPCTTFSILLAAAKGDIDALISGAEAIGGLADGDKVLIAEACTHHAAKDDIGRVKIPRLIEKRSGAHLSFDVCAGRDFPEDLSGYRLIVQCGGCMIGRREVLSRIREAQKHHIPITNYGMAISFCRGVLPRVTALFRRERRG
ncbi:MAG: [FeFe] hydrogenase H-cluster maturation GTPase HydF [Victivallaceae bacterium]|nr:[FeFe] hydrogenase H-cluster maturation GTPase HydF [Victivallaceae bacterium]